MAEAKQQSENDQSRPMSKKGKDLLTRRNFIASTAGLAAMNLVGRAAQKKVE